MAALDIIASELLKSAREADLKYKKTRDLAERDRAIRLRKIVENLKLIPLGASDLDGLSDVTISAPANAQVLTYNSTTGQWENQTPGGGGGGGDMYKSTYDVDNDGIVDGSETTQIIVRNSTGSTLTKGQVVYLSGATGNRPNAVLSQANTEATSSKTIGIVVANINNNSDGFVAVNGTLHNLDTSAFTAGDAVWLSATTAGAFTSTIPAEPNHTVFIGYIARSHPTQGRIVILIQNGYELNELHGVQIASEANNDLLVYESSTALWKNKSISTIFGGTPLVSVPTLAQVTTAGNTTTNAITVGGFTSNASSTIIGAAAGTIGTRVLTVEGSLPEIWFKDTFSGAASFVLSKYGSAFYFARTTSTGVFQGYSGAIVTDSWSFGHGSNPAATVHVRGANVLSSTKAFLVQNSSPSDLLTIWNDGAVGINTSTNAGYKLDVNGTARIVNKTNIGSETVSQGSLYVGHNGTAGGSNGTSTVFFVSQFGNYPYRLGAEGNGYDFYLRQANGGQGSINIDFSGLNSISYNITNTNVLNQFFGKSVIIDAKMSLNSYLAMGTRFGFNDSLTAGDSPLIFFRSMSGSYYDKTLDAAVTIRNGLPTVADNNITKNTAYWYRNGYIGIGTSTTLSATNTLKGAITINQGTTIGYQNLNPGSLSSVITSGTSTTVTFTPNNGNVVPGYDIIVGTIITANGVSRRVTAVNYNSITVDSAVDWSAGYNYTYRNPYVSIADGSTPIFDILPSGNVAVGTTTAVAKFTVAGSITAASALAQGVFFNNTLVAAANNDVLVGLDINPTFTNGAFTGVTNYAIRSVGTFYQQLPGFPTYGLSISTDASGHSYITKPNSTDLVISGAGHIKLNSGGFIGIGIPSGASSPKTLFSVYGANSPVPSLGTANGLFTVLSGSVPGQYGLQFSVAGTGMAYIQNMRVDASATAYTLSIQPAGGNVLIGTGTDAGYKLDVNGSSRITGNLTITAGGVGTNTFNANVNYLFANQNNVYGLVDLQNAAGQSVFFKVTGAPTTGTVFDYFWISGTTTSSTIGTTRNIFNVSPTYNLTGAFTGTMRGFYYNPTLTSMTGATHRAIETTSGDVIFNGGNVGIGVTPIYKLDVNGVVRFQSTGTTSVTHSFLFRNDNSSYGGFTIGSSGQALSIQQANGYGYLTATGFYIGSANGTIWTNNGSVFRISNPAETITYFRIHDTTGNVSINNSTDAGYKLDVNGTARFQGFTTVSATTLVNGDAALTIQSTTNNSVVGQLYGINNIVTASTNVSNISGINSAVNTSSSASLMAAVQGQINISANTVTEAKGFTTNPAATGTGTFTRYIGFDNLAVFKAGSGSVGTQIFLRSQYLNAASNNIGLLLQDAAAATVVGNWAIHDQTGYGSYFKGSIGIGTTTLTRQLNISGTNPVVLLNATAASYAGINLKSSAGNLYVALDGSTPAFGTANASVFWSDINAPMIFAVLNVERVRIHANGNFAIGTTTDAGYKLDVNGTAIVQTNLNVGDTAFTATTPNYISLGGTYANSGYGAKLKLLDSGSTQWGLGISTAGINYYGSFHNFFAGTTTAAIVISPSADTASTSPAYISIGQSYSSVAGANPKLRLFGTTYGLGVSAGQVDYIAPSHVFYANGTEAMRITSAGYIGVGTTSPTDIFHIVNNTNGNKFGRISAGGSDASAAWVAQNDQVDNVVYRVFGSGVSGTQMGIALARSASLMANLGGSGKFLLGTYSNTDFVMGTGNAEKMRIVDSTGNVLIATTTDLGNKLEVNGTINATAYKINNIAGYTGILNIPLNPPGMQNVDIQSGIIVNIF